MTCDGCGAVVGDTTKHQQFHDTVDAIHALGDEALEKAEYAANVLYQNGIEV